MQTGRLGLEVEQEMVGDSRRREEVSVKEEAANGINDQAVVVHPLVFKQFIHEQFPANASLSECFASAPTTHTHLWTY